MISGRYSATMPTDLRERYERGINDPKLLELRDEIAMLDAFTDSLLEKMGSGETYSHWMAVSTTWAKFMMAIRTGDAKVQKKLLPMINDLIIEGATQAQERQEVTELADRRRRLVETEQKRIISNAQTVPVDEAIAMIRMVVESTKYAANKYTDPETARLIISGASEAYERLLGGGLDSPNRALIVDGRVER